MSKQTWQLWVEGTEQVEVVEGGLSQDGALALALDLAPEGTDSKFWVLPADHRDGCMVIKSERINGCVVWTVRNVDVDSQEWETVSVWQVGYCRGENGRIVGPWAQPVR
jgi:hypothetical protein